ncbi:cytochrome P450 [Artemisia annua]|uniref:Cytochrome P450 n=1 Tax=Artemisia annua TaxID=35608 RepID=A0A2U1MP86_ARTAN|nr:cytochrome P450 [Artemisia annua]
MVEFQDYFSLCLICLVFTVFIWKLSKLIHANYRLPPSPFALPIIGHLHLLVLAPSPHRAFHKLSIRYGPVFRLYLGSTPCVVVSSPETAKEIFKTHDYAFLDKPHNSSVDRISYGANAFIFAPYGSYWKFMKKIVMSQLLNTRTLDVLLPVRNDEINRLIKCLSQKAIDGRPVELGLELMKMTNNVISRMLMGKRCSEEEDEAEDIRKIITEISELIGKFNLSDHIWFCKNLDLQGFGKQSMDIHIRLDAMLERVLREHQEATKQKKDTGHVRDLLDILLDISEDENMEMKLTTDSIKAFILDIFAAGTETSAITVEWTLAELINHPNIMKKAVEEIDQVVGKNRLLQESDIPNLPYLQAIVKESLRLHPVAPLIQRLSTEDCTLGGYHIPANTTIFINVWEVGRDPGHWENPLEFMPERFENKQLDVRGRHFQLVPFGGGRRMCPGTSLALMVVHVTLGSMIQCFNWKAGKAGDLNSIDMEEGIGVALPRANPLVCIPVARLHPIPLSA